MRAPKLASTLLTLLTILAPAAGRAAADESFTVQPITVADEKAVFATVESASVVPARARIPGTVAELGVKEGDEVKSGQVVAHIGDEKIALQMRSLDAQIAGLEAQLAQAQTDLSRAEELFGRGTIPRTRLDEARTALNVATNAHRARTAEKAVVAQQLAEGAVLAPTPGRVLKVPVTAGTVVMSGEPIAMVAEQNFVLRLRVPERHARFLRAGNVVRVDSEQLGIKEGAASARFGTVRLVYPQIEDGRVVADAEVAGLGDYFVGERIRVWVSGGDRTALIVPAPFITTRFGVDYARVQGADGKAVEVPVQRGRELPRPEEKDGIEILSGLKAGDRLLRPERAAREAVSSAAPTVKP
jgi:RND family efflux transporter MFP subunit